MLKICVAGMSLNIFEDSTTCRIIWTCYTLLCIALDVLAKTHFLCIKYVFYRKTCDFVYILEIRFCFCGVLKSVFAEMLGTPCISDHRAIPWGGGYYVECVASVNIVFFVCMKKNIQVFFGYNWYWWNFGWINFLLSQMGIEILVSLRKLEFYYFNCLFFFDKLMRLYYRNLIFFTAVIRTSWYVDVCVCTCLCVICNIVSFLMQILK